jgi:hypothetical protein
MFVSPQVQLTISAETGFANIHLPCEAEGETPAPLEVLSGVAEVRCRAGRLNTKILNLLHQGRKEREGVYPSNSFFADLATFV